MLETEFIKDEISGCESFGELKQRVLPLLVTQKEQWAKKISEIIEINGYSKTSFAEICKTSRQTVDKWCKGAIPKNRETFLTIGMAANYDVEQMNQLLQRYGRYPELYSKSLEDCVCIFVLENDYGKEALSKYRYILNKIKENLIRDDLGEREDLSTVKFDEKLFAVKDEDELERFITENISMFTYAYHKFYAYVKMCITANYDRNQTTVYDMANDQEWSSSLKQCVSAINQNKWYPTRNKIISLGLHLNMELDQIDKMLRYAHMEPLCAKNIFESVIMFVLKDASSGGMLNRDSELFYQNELCEYARDILSELDLPEIESFLSELPEEE